MAWRSTISEDEDIPDETAVVPHMLENNDEDHFWPSAVFHNVTYPNGIMVDNDDDCFVLKNGYCNDTSSAGACHSLPCLTPSEAKLWCHKHAAHTAVARLFPIEVGHLLGTITLEIQQKGKAKDNALVPQALVAQEEK